MNYKIRDLKNSDRKLLTAMLEKLAVELCDNGIRDIIRAEVARSESVSSNDSTIDSIVKYGGGILHVLLKYLDNEMSDWFADLLCVTREQLLDMPFDIETNIINQLMTAAVAKSFFTQASHIFKTMKLFAKPQS